MAVLKAYVPHLKRRLVLLRHFISCIENLLELDEGMFFFFAEITAKINVFLIIALFCFSKRKETICKRTSSLDSVQCHGRGVSDVACRRRRRLERRVLRLLVIVLRARYKGFRMTTNHIQQKYLTPNLTQRKVASFWCRANCSSVF